MLTFPRPIRCSAVLVSALGLICLLASPVAAQRPSLIDLQAAIDGLVSPAPAPAAGTVSFAGGSGTFEFDVVQFALSANRVINCELVSCASGFSSFAVELTVVATPEVALLSDQLLQGLPQTIVVKRLPEDPKSLPIVFVTFGNATLTAIDGASEPGRVRIQFEFVTVQIELNGPRPGWNRSTDTAFNSMTCTGVSNGQVHVDLAGNPSSNLNSGEIESTQKFTVAPSSIEVAYSRRPIDPCYLMVAAVPSTYLDVSFERLWSMDDAFAGRQSVETIDLENVVIAKWTLRMDSGEITEDVELFVPPPGATGVAVTQTLRTFDPATGGETNSQVFGY